MAGMDYDENDIVNDPNLDPRVRRFLHGEITLEELNAPYWGQPKPLPRPLKIIGRVIIAVLAALALIVLGAWAMK